MGGNPIMVLAALMVLCVWRLTKSGSPSMAPIRSPMWRIARAEISPRHMPSWASLPIFDLTYGEIASKRSNEDIRQAIGDHILGSNFDLEASRPDLERRAPQSDGKRGTSLATEVNVRWAATARYGRSAAARVKGLLDRLRGP
jgi:hypothetical protein